MGTDAVDSPDVGGGRAARSKLVSVALTLQRRLKGFHVLGEVINLGKVWPFLFATFVLLFDTFCKILQHKLKAAHVPGRNPSE